MAGDENDLTRLLAAAQAHGEEEGADTEAGDLQEFLKAAYGLLTARQRGKFWDDPAVATVVQEIPEYAAVCRAVYGRGQEEEDAG